MPEFQIHIGIESLFTDKIDFHMLQLTVKTFLQTSIIILNVKLFLIQTKAIIFIKIYVKILFENINVIKHSNICKMCQIITLCVFEFLMSINIFLLHLTYQIYE